MNLINVKKINRSIEVYKVIDGKGKINAISAYNGFFHFLVVEIRNNTEKRDNGGVKTSGVNSRANFLYFISGN